MSYQPKGPGPIPNRWLYCPRKSENIIAEHFIAFKTPLSSAFTDQMPMECLFLPDMIFDWCKTVKHKLGLWIDLTNTKRFYDRSIVEKHGAQYVKLQCRGHGETPSKEQTHAFIEIVDNFINERPLEMIGVHCTHGFNRTGFLIISYLVERLDYSVDAALSVFSQSRPPGIYKQDYINELFLRYESEEETIAAPELPDWCNEYDDSDGHPITNNAHKRHHNDAFSSTSQQGMGNDGSNFESENINGLDDGDQAGDDDGDGTSNGKKSRKKPRREMVIKNATFMEGVPGVQLVTDQPRLRMLQRKVHEMCGWGKSGFPGAQPISMDLQNLKNLHNMPYRVSWKADGNRYMMLINKRDEIFFFDRNHSCFEVEGLTFLKAGKLDEHLEDTLVDGEMVLDKYQGTTTPRFLIYDVVQIGDRNVGSEPFYPNRLHCIKNEIIEPRYIGIMQSLIDRSSEPFSVRNKDFWEIGQAASLLSEKFAKSLAHEPDGLIFQPSKDPYTAGVCPNVLKWKPSELNSVDFRLKIVTETGTGILTKKIGLLFVGGHNPPFDRIPWNQTIKTLDNKIIECTVNRRGQWEFMRERTDKKEPNSYRTAAAVIESIRHPVTKEKLLEFIRLNGFRDDHDNMMMPPPSTHHVQRSHHAQQMQQNHHPRHQHDLQQQHHHPRHQHDLQQQHQQPNRQQF